MDAYLTRQEEIDFEHQFGPEALPQTAAPAASSSRIGGNVKPQPQSTTSSSSALQPFSQRFSQLWASRLQEPHGGWNANNARDPIHRRINKELRRLREASYECFKLSLQVWPASDAPIDFKNGMSSIKFFHFAEGGVLLSGSNNDDGFGVPPHVAPVMLVQDCYSSDHAQDHQDDEEMHLKVRFNGRWRSFENFLHHLCDRSVVPVENALDIQYNWWRSNGKSFNLLGLPAEIRERIYYFAFRPEVSPASSQQQQQRSRKTLRLTAAAVSNDDLDAPDQSLTVKPHRYSRWPSRGKVHVSTAPSVRLLRANKQISREAAHVLYRSACFEFDSPRQLEEFFCSIGGNFENLRHIALRFGPKDLLKFFGASLTEERRWEPSFAAFHLMYLANKLLTLEIELPRPGLLVEHEFLWDEANQRGCVNKVVEWILFFAKPFVRNLPLSLTGCIDEEMKREFLEGLRAERNAIEEVIEDEKESGGVPLELDSGYDTGNDEHDYFQLPVARECASPIGRDDRRTYVAESL